MASQKGIGYDISSVEAEENLQDAGAAPAAEVGGDASGQGRRDPWLRRNAATGRRRAAGQRRRLRQRVPGAGDFDQGRRRDRRGDRAHQPLRLASHGRHGQRELQQGAAFSARGRFVFGHDQCLDAL